MPAICYALFRTNDKLKFASLQSALDYTNKAHEAGNYVSPWMVSEIVYRNVEYRNYLRTNGLEALIARLIKEAPELADNTGAISRLKKGYESVGIADYDVQIVSIHDEITLLGHTFKGIDEIIHRCEAEFDLNVHCKFSTVEAEPLADVHIVNVYEVYSTYVSREEDYETRKRQTFLFGTTPFASEKDFAEFMNGKRPASELGNDVFCETFDPKLLPAVYYDSSCDYMLVLTKAGDAPTITAPEEATVPKATPEKPTSENPNPIKPALKEKKEKFGVGWKIYLAVIFLMPVYSGIVYAVKSSAVSLIAFLMSIAAIVLMPKLRMSTFFLMNALLLASLILTTLRLFGVL